MIHTELIKRIAGVHIDILVSQLPDIEVTGGYECWMSKRENGSYIVDYSGLFKVDKGKKKWDELSLLEKFRFGYRSDYEEDMYINEKRNLCRFASFDSYNYALAYTFSFMIDKGILEKDILLLNLGLGD